MRTTVNISDELLAEVKIRANRSHRTIGDVLEDALRGYLAHEDGGRPAVALPDFEYTGGINVDLYDKDALDAVMNDALS